MAAFRPNLMCCRLKPLLQKLVTIEEACIDNEYLLQLLGELALEIRPTIKDRSYDGVFFIRARAVDLGNWQYSVAFHVMRSLAARKLNAGADPFQLLLSSFESLMGNSELQGDILECVLATLLLTGNAVDAKLRETRIKLHVLLPELVQCVWALGEECQDFGTVPVDKIMPSRAFTNYIFSAHYAHQTTDRIGKRNHARTYEKIIIQTGFKSQTCRRCTSS